MPSRTCTRAALGLPLLLALGASPACRGPRSHEGSTGQAVVEAAADATLFAESGSKGDGAGAHLFVGRNSRGDLRRALVRFDLGELPSGVTIRSASVTLTVDHTSSGTVPVTLRRVLESWGEGSADSGGGGAGARAEADDATWSRRELAGAAWGTPGATLAPETSASAEVGGPGVVTWSSPELVRDVQAWIDAPSSNHGWAILGAEELDGTAKRFCSREHAEPAARPRLDVSFARR